MVVTKQQMVDGIMSYIDEEVMNKLPTSGKWVVGTIVYLGKDKATTIMDSLLDNVVIKAMHVVDDDGHIDYDKIIDALRLSANKYGSVEMDVPIVGKLKFNASDVDTLGSHISKYGTLI